MSSRSNGVEHASEQGAKTGARVLSSLRRAATEPLLRNGLYMMGTTAVTSLLGFGFWLIAARNLTAADVGHAAAVVSAMLFVAVITNLGIGQVLVSRLASRSSGREWSLTVTTGLLATILASIAGGTIAAAIVPVVVPGLEEELGIAAFFLLPLGVAAIACSLVLDFACIAERQARPSFLRNTWAALIRLALVAAAAMGPLDSATWLMTIWVGSFLLIDAHGALRTLPGLDRGFQPSLHGWRRELTEIRRLVAGHQTINLGSQATAYVLPVIVSARLGATDNAYFYATFMLASGLFFIAPAISNSLFAEAAHRPGQLRGDLGRAARYILALATPPTIVLLLAGPTLLKLFGAGYADAGTILLYVLVASAPLDAAYQLAIAVARARGRLGQAAAASWAMLIASIGSAWLLLEPLGLVGAGVAWGIGKVCGLLAIVVILARPTSVATIRTQQDTNA